MSAVTQLGPLRSQAKPRRVCTPTFHPPPTGREERRGATGRAVHPLELGEKSASELHTSPYRGCRGEPGETATGDALSGEAPPPLTSEWDGRYVAQSLQGEVTATDPALWGDGVHA